MSVLKDRLGRAAKPLIAAIMTEGSRGQRPMLGATWLSAAWMTVPRKDASAPRCDRRAEGVVQCFHHAAGTFEGADMRYRNANRNAT